MTDRLCWGALAVGALATLVVFVGIATHWLVVGSSAGAWAYRYVQHFSIDSVIIGLLAAGAAGSLARLPVPEPGRREWLLLAIWLVVALGLQAFVRSLNLFSLESIFLSDGANSFYSVTQRVDAGTVLGDFSRVRRDAPLHAQSNMPGKLMLLYALQLLSARPDVLPWLIVIVSNLGGLLMYAFVRDLFGDRTVALYATVLYLFVPAKLLFLPLMNTVTPVPMLVCLCVLMRWLQTGAPWLAALLGVSLYGLAFFEPLPLVMGLVFAGLSLRAVVRGDLTQHAFVVHTAVMLIAFIATAELVQFAFGFNLVGTFRRIGEHAVAFNATEGRPYAVWVFANLWEFAFGIGMCQAALFVAALVGGLTAPGGARDRLTQPITVLCGGLLAVLLAVDLIGVNRGEVVRLWIFLACAFQIPAAYVCARLRRPEAVAIVVFLSVVHGALATSLIGFIIP